MKKDLNDYIKKNHIRAVEKFNEDLKAWAKETGEDQPTLYEDAFTSFTLSDVCLKQGTLFYTYDGEREFVGCVVQDLETGEYYETEGIDSIMEYVKFWRACLRRAKRFWVMDPDHLDAIQNGEAEFHDEDEEEEEE